MPDPVAGLGRALQDRYVIERPLGRGGMATVYVATDLRHGRKVAMKVLRPDVSAAIGAERFLAEIRTTAGLRHPHIMPLHDSGECDGVLYYVMPLIEGESLRERLDRERQLPVDECVHIATAVAEALDAAHAAGVVHRDVKPDNILLDRGQPLVCDFGIALAAREDDGQRLTQAGVSIGTPRYMSPEQAAGDRAIDARSDVFSLGCVLYEMLTGEPAFDGQTAQAVLARVLTGLVEPPRALRPAVPPHVDAVVRKALERVPADRFDGCGDMARALADPTFRHGLDGVGQLTRRARRWRRLAAAAGLAAAASWIVLVGGLLGPDAPEPVTRFTVRVGPLESLVGRHSVAVSPDGRQVAFIGGSSGGARLYVRPLGALEARVVPGTGGAVDPFFSPDAAWVGFATTDGVFRVPMSGGEPEGLVDFSEARGMHWTSEDGLFFGSYQGLWRVDLQGGDPERLTSVRAERGEAAHTRPFLLPGRETVLFTVVRADTEPDRIAGLDLRTGEIRDVGQGVTPRLLSTGHLLYGRADGVLMAAPFDPGDVRMPAPGQPVVSQVQVKPGLMEYDVAADGTLVYFTGSSAPSELVLVGRDGDETPLGMPNQYNGPRFSPTDGRRIAVGVGQPPDRQIWVVDVGGGTMSPVTYEGNNYYAVWSADGTRVTFARETSGAVDIYWKSADGTGQAESLLRNGGFNYPESWSPDGRYLVYRVQDSGGAHDVWALDVAEDGRTIPVLQAAGQEEAPKVAPGGRWLAYSSDVSGESEVYVVRFPEGSDRARISLRGGAEPVWSGERELIYWRADTLVVATLELESEVRVSSRRALLAGQGPYVRWIFHGNYDVSSDGDAFVMVRRSGTEERRLVIVRGWLSELDSILGG